VITLYIKDRKRAEKLKKYKKYLVKQHDMTDCAAAISGSAGFIARDAISKGLSAVNVGTNIDGHSSVKHIYV
jgi:hypothetical protein